MRLKQLLPMVLALVTAGLILVTNTLPGLTQANYGPRAIEDLPIQSNPLVKKAPVVIDGREIFSVGKIGNTPAG
jgi:potassium-dependent mechanosensitive channel